MCGRYPELYEKSDKCIIASDLHCKEECNALCTLINIAIENKIGVMVIIGDLFDKMHFPCSCEYVFSKIKDLIRRCHPNSIVRNTLKILYLTSRSSHDPILDRDCEIIFSLNSIDFTLTILTHPVYIILNGTRLFLTHGEIFVKNGAAAFILNVFAKVLGTDLFLEKTLKRKLKLAENTWLVMGHTHIPGIDYQYRVANTGGWRRVWKQGIPYWRKAYNTYILVEKGKLKLKSF